MSGASYCRIVALSTNRYNTKKYSLFNTTMSDNNNASNIVSGVRGASFTTAEDVFVCRAWVSASEDPLSGTALTGPQFKKIHYKKYVSLIVAHNSSCNNVVSFSTRKITSVSNRFKLLSARVQKLVAIDSNTELESGWNENDRKEAIKATFTNRHPDWASSLPTILDCQKVLEEHQKWRDYLVVMDKEAERSARPGGAKKAKRQEEEKKEVESIVNSIESKVVAASNNMGHAKTQFYESMGGAVSDIGKGKFARKFPMLLLFVSFNILQCSLVFRTSCRCIYGTRTSTKNRRNEVERGRASEERARSSRTIVANSVDSRKK